MPKLVKMEFLQFSCFLFLSHKNHSNWFWFNHIFYMDCLGKCIGLLRFSRIYNGKSFPKNVHFCKCVLKITKKLQNNYQFSPKIEIRIVQVSGITKADAYLLPE
jgi:hypothetical protein